MDQVSPRPLHEALLDVGAPAELVVAPAGRVAFARPAAVAAGGSAR